MHTMLNRRFCFHARRLKWKILFACNETSLVDFCLYVFRILFVRKFNLKRRRQVKNDKHVSENSK